MVELNVAASEFAAGRVARQPHAERVEVLVWITVIGHVRRVSKAALAVNLRCPLNVTASWTRRDVRRDAGAVHTGTAGAVVVVLQMTPERAVLHAARHRKSSLRA